jgi:hypothetical protein
MNKPVGAESSLGPQYIRKEALADSPQRRQAAPPPYAYGGQMKFLNNLWRLLRARRDALLEEAKEAARMEAKKVATELLKGILVEIGGNGGDSK